jgi:maleamate amidohydrolase
VAEDLSQNYAKAGYHHSLGFGERPALILVDFVQAYFEPESPLYAGVDAALASALRVLAAARAAGAMRIMTNVKYYRGGIDGGIFTRKVPALKCFEEGNPLGRWPQGLDPRDDEIIVSKQYPSAFFGTSLAATLTAAKIDTLVITGLTTSGCVRATCVDAMSCGFIPVVVREAVGDRAPQPHEANLFDMSAKYGDVVSEADAIAYFRRRHDLGTASRP